MNMIHSSYFKWMSPELLGCGSDGTINPEGVGPPGVRGFSKKKSADPATCPLNCVRFTDHRPPPFLASSNTLHPSCPIFCCIGDQTPPPTSPKSSPPLHFVWSLIFGKSTCLWGAAAPIKNTCVRGVAAIPMESLVVRTTQEGAGNTFNSAGGAYRNGVARLFENKIWVAEIYLEMREINPNVSIRAVSLAASVGKFFATKVVSEVESGALINPCCLQVRYCEIGWLRWRLNEAKKGGGL